MAFKIEDKVIKVQKDCQTCEHIKVCKFHSKARELFKSNEFYEMTEYLEWNNNLKVFELHSSCRFFELNYTIPDDGSVTLDTHPNIINEIVHKNIPEGYNQTSVLIKKNLLEFRSIGKEDLQYNLLEFIQNTGIKFVPKK